MTDCPDMPQIANHLGIRHQAPVAWKDFVPGSTQGGSMKELRCTTSVSRASFPVTEHQPGLSAQGGVENISLQLEMQSSRPLVRRGG